MPVEIMILFIIIAAGAAAYFYVESRTLRQINEDKHEHIKELNEIVEAHQTRKFELETRISQLEKQLTSSKKTRKKA